MIKNFRLVFSLCSGLFLVLLLQTPVNTAEADSFVTTLTEEGVCGHEGTGTLQYLKNPDESNAYEVTIKTVEMHKGKEKDTTKTVHIKAGGKKHLGCTLSEIMPLTSYERVIVSETK